METLTEREKMVSGQLYLASDPELVALRRRARKLLGLYNATVEDDTSTRFDLIRELFGTVGSRTIIEPPFYCDYGLNIHAGDSFFMNFGCVILDCAEIRIGSHVLFGPYVQVYAASHPLDPGLRSSGPELAKSITIGNRVWIGGGSILCPGIQIGDGTTIGAGSVVTKDIPANVLAAGNPCRVIRELSQNLSKDPPLSKGLSQGLSQ